MKNSSLQIDQVVYTNVVIRAKPGAKEKLHEDLPVTAEVAVFHGANKNNLATLDVQQNDDSYPYVIKVSAFASITLDAKGCKDAYKNVARVLFSSVRDWLPASPLDRLGRWLEFRQSSLNRLMLQFGTPRGIAKTSCASIF